MTPFWPITLEEKLTGGKVSIYYKENQRKQWFFSDDDIAVTACDGGNGCSHPVNMRGRVDIISLWRQKDGKTLGY